MTLIEKYRALPRVTRWALLAGAGIAIYFVGVERLIDWSNAQRAEAERIAKSLSDRAKLANERESTGGLLERSIVAFGSPRAPVSVSDPVDALSRKINDLARKHEVTIKRRSERPRSTINGLEWRGQKIDRVQLEVTVECDTEKFLALLKDIETSPEIASVSTLRLQKQTEPGKSLSESSLMQVTFIPELWATAKGSTSAGPAPTSSPELTPEENNAVGGTEGAAP